MKTVLKVLVLGLVLFTLCYATAPDWIVKEVSVNYTSGTDLITFTVLGKTTTGIQTQVYYKSTSHRSMTTENISADSGMYWFDPTLLASAYEGMEIGDYTVDSEGEQTIAGKTWDTVTLEATLSGADTEKIFDKETGLLLKQTVVMSGVPAVVFSNRYVPVVEPPPAPPTTQTSTTSSGSTQATSHQNTSGTGTQQSSSGQQSSGHSSTTGSGNTNSSASGNAGQSGNSHTQTASADTQTDNGASGSQQNTSAGTSTAAKKKPCCPSTALILLVLGVLVVKSKG